jgi:hypothetical protein
MEKGNFTKDSLTINGREIPVEIGFCEQEKLKFWQENPRVYSVICAGEKNISQEEIEKRLSEREHVKLLVQSIKANGGLTDPIIVRGGDFVVLEGNSRLAAYRILFNSDPIKWGKIKCKILPKNIDDSLVFMLLGEYHIIGRKDWQPYEQAGYLYRRYKLQKVPLDDIQRDLGIRKSEIEHLVAVYSFMIENNDTDVSRWSYYEEYLKSAYIKKVREEYPKFDELVVKKIKGGEINKAIDIREKLIPITKASPKTVKNFANGKVNFEVSYERAISGGAGNVILERLHRFREFLASSEIEEEISENDEQVFAKCNFELIKIYKRIHDILHKIGKK